MKKIFFNSLIGFLFMIPVVLISQTQAAPVTKDPQKKMSIWEQWPALDEYHKTMAMTFHPAENNDLGPLKKYGADLFTQAKALKKSTIPDALNKPGLNKIVVLLAKESKTLSKMVKAEKSDEELKKSIFALHDRFHQIVEKCVHE